MIKIIEFMKENSILKREIISYKCSKPMGLEKNIQYIDKYAWRCRSKRQLHDNKICMRNDSIFENIRIPIKLYEIL